jgi:hypothetical protein
VGYACTLDPTDFPTLKAAMELPLTDLQTPKAGLYPEFETIELLSGQLPARSFYQLLETFAREAQLDGKYFFSNQESLLMTAKALEQVRVLK